MPELSWQKVLVVLVIALIVLGPAKLPEVMRSVGKGVREFRGAMGSLTGLSDMTSPRASNEPNADEPRIHDVHPTHQGDRVSELPPPGSPGGSAACRGGLGRACHAGCRHPSLGR